MACALAFSGDALAFHAGSVFDKPAGAGGGGGIFYVGSATERGWNCTACHTEPAGKIRVTLTSDPPGATVYPAPSTNPRDDTVMSKRCSQ